MKGVDFMQLKKAEREEINAQSSRFSYRVGSTVYTVNACFSNTTSETLADKILRLAQNDGLDFQAEQSQKSLRTGRSSERSAV
jgi:hypothetical protein